MIRHTLNITVIFSIFIFLISTNCLQSQWEKITNIEIGYVDNYWLDVFFLPANPQYGWICCFNGKVIRTIDGGNSWEGTTIFGVDQLESIHFANELVGYTSGNSNIFKSTDGGITWFDVSPLFANILWGCYFLDEDNGGVIGGGCNDDYQNFYRTTDGGISWKLFKGFELNSGLADFIIYNDGTGFASSSGRIWKTTDSGFSWDIFSISGDNDWQEEITNYNQSFLVPYSLGCSGSSSGGGIRFTTNNGNNWLQWVTGQPMYGTFLLDSLRGWACGWNSLVLFTIDGGKTWINKNCGIDKNNNLDDIWFVNDTLGFVVGRGVYRTAEINILNPEILAWGDNYICKGDSVMLYPKEDYKHYKWSTGSKNRYIWVNKPGKYYLIAANDECDSTTSNVIEVFFHQEPVPPIQSTEGNQICTGDSTILFSGNNYLSYYWSTGDTTKNTLVKEEGLYQLFVIDSNGCKGRNDYYVKINPLPEPKIKYYDDSLICDEDYLLLKTEENYVSYKWFDEFGNELQADDNTYGKISESGKYRVVVVDSNGCRGESPIFEAVIKKDSNHLVIKYLPQKEIFIIDSTNIITLNCDSLEIYNKSQNYSVINDLYLFYGTEFSIPLSQFPITIEPYSSKKIQICVSPAKLGVIRDTVLCPDICSGHIIPLETYSIPNIYFGEGNCNTQIKLETLRLYSKGFVTSQPYPNPAQSVAQIDFIGQKKNDTDFKINSEVFDIFGNKRLEAEIVYEDIITQENKSFVIGKILFNLKNLENGLFIIVVSNESNSVLFQLIINN